jgi:uncharacterized protein (TIGR03000 family)
LVTGMLFVLAGLVNGQSRSIDSTPAPPASVSYYRSDVDCGRGGTPTSQPEQPTSLRTPEPPDAPPIDRTPRPAALLFSVPDRALVWIDNQLLMQIGPERQFITPAIPGGRDRVYSIRVKWRENGQPRSHDQWVCLKPGAQTRLTVFGAVAKR